MGRRGTLRAAMLLALSLGSSTLFASTGAACNPDATTLCLNAGRFKVQTQWTTTQPATGAGQAVALTSDTGYFWFFSANNVEMVVKVVDGRPVNARFWVFAGGLTNVAVQMTVTDTQTGVVRNYANPQGVAFQPIQDTNAFPGAAVLELSKVGTPAEEMARDFRPSTLDLGLASAACVSDATTLCLNGGRFKVQVQWNTPQGQSGAGQAVALTSDTGYFWFFSANNVEMVIKVVTGCPVNSRFWVFAGGLTNVNVIITVTDTLTGAVQTYTNIQGAAFQPIQDTNAFSACAPPPDAFVGTWTGNWVNNTFSTSGPASMVVTVDTASQTVSVTVTLGGNVLGGTAPPPQTFTGSYATGSVVFSIVSAVFGNINATINSSGILSGSATNLPNPNISRVDFNGTVTPLQITINYTVTFAGGGGSANGVMTLNRS